MPLPARADIRPSSTSSSRVSPGHDLAAEPGTVEATEQRQLAGEALVGQHGDGAHLGDRLAHQHAGQRRPAREVTGEEPLVAGEVPSARGATDRLEGDDLVDEQERRPVRRQIGVRAGQRPDRWTSLHRSSASSSFTGVSFGLILYQTCAACRRRRPGTPSGRCPCRSCRRSSSPATRRTPRPRRGRCRRAARSRGRTCRRNLAERAGLSGLTPSTTVSPSSWATSRSRQACWVQPGRVGLRVEVHQHVLPRNVASVDALAVLVEQRDGRSRLTLGEHAPQSSRRSRRSGHAACRRRAIDEATPSIKKI